MPPSVVMYAHQLNEVHQKLYTIKFKRFSKVKKVQKSPNYECPQEEEQQQQLAVSLNHRSSIAGKKKSTYFIRSIIVKYA